eukprot:gene11882-24895_t
MAGFSELPPSADAHDAPDIFPGGDASPPALSPFSEVSCSLHRLSRDIRDSHALSAKHTSAQLLDMNASTNAMIQKVTANTTLTITIVKNNTLETHTINTLITELASVVDARATSTLESIDVLTTLMESHPQSTSDNFETLTTITTALAKSVRIGVKRSNRLDQRLEDLSLIVSAHNEATEARFTSLHIELTREFRTLSTQLTTSLASTDSQIQAIMHQLAQSPDQSRDYESPTRRISHWLITSPFIERASLMEMPIINTTTDYTPYFLTFERECRTPLDSVIPFIPRFRSKVATAYAE